VLEKFRRIPNEWNTLLYLFLQKGQIFMAQVKKTQRSQYQQGQTEFAKSALGIYTELGHKSKTDEALNLQGHILKTRAAKGIRDNFTLADTIHTLLRKYEGNPYPYIEYIRTDKKKIPSFARNLICGHILEKYTAIKKTIEYGSYVHTNIAHCSNIWLCPLCASQIQSRRAEEVQTAITWAETQGLQVVMITYTASHKANYALKDFGVRFQKAYRATMKQVYRLRKQYEEGNIKATEFTFSEKNRWHKHSHVLIFLKKECDADAFFKEIQQAWERQCSKVGLLDISNEKALADFRKHGCDMVKGAQESLARYTNKSASEWTISDEMAKSVLKIGKNKEHITPFQMVVEIATTRDMGYRYRLIDAFFEYALYTKGLHQMDWSNGLKAKVGIEDKTDEEIMEEEKDDAEFLAGLTVAHWYQLRSKYLRILYFRMLKENGTYEGIVDFFDQIAGNDCPDVLTADQARLLETYEDKCCDFTEAEEAEYESLQVVLDAVAEATPREYSASKNYKPSDFIKMSEAQKRYEQNKQKWDLLDMHITDADVKAIQSLTPSEIEAYKAKFDNRFNIQLSLFENCKQ